MTDYLISVLVADYNLPQYEYLYQAIMLGYVSPFTTSKITADINRFMEKAPVTVEGLSSAFWSLPLSLSVPLAVNDSSFLMWDGLNLYVVKESYRQRVVKVMCLKNRKFSTLAAKTFVTTHMFPVTGVPPTIFTETTINFVTAFAPVLNTILAARSLAEEEERSVVIGRWLSAGEKEEAGGAVF